MEGGPALGRSREDVGCRMSDIGIVRQAREDEKTIGREDDRTRRR